MSRTKSDETKNRILDAAWRLLEGDDPAKSRMGDIAKAAGISRQALYLHYPSRTELLVATARHIDVVKDVDARLQPSRDAKTGVERLENFIAFWGDYVPEVGGVARAFLSLMESDEAARAAWNDRLTAVRHGCHAAVRDLKRDGALQQEWSVERATDWLASHLSIEGWLHLVRQCGWSQRYYTETLQRIARQALTTRGA